MKYFILLALLLVPSMAQAQTPVSKETANTYFNNCVNQSSSQQFSQNGKNNLCACTAARLTQYFTVEEWTAMSSQDPNIARPAYNKMMVDVYAPCMEEPTRETYYNLCMQNPGVDQNICRCTGDAIAQHMKTNGSQIFAGILSMNPTITDPMAALERDAGFNEFKRSAAMKCAQK